MKKICWLMGVMWVMMASLCGASPIGSDEYFEAVGHGYAAEFAMIEDVEYRQATAYEAAEMDAYANILKQINGAKITADSTIHNMRLTDKNVAMRLEGVVKNAIVTDVKYSNNSCTVTVRVPKFGKNSVASAVVPTYNPVAVPSAPTNPNIVNQMAIPTEGYTGLVIDCRGLEVSTAMCPAIVATNGQKIYGYQNVSRDFIINHGMISYCRDGMVMKRAGNHPLVIKAVNMENHDVNAVISVEDADKIVVANNISHFLENCNVTFLRD